LGKRIVMSKQAVRWIAFITALNCGAVLALTQCSSFEGLRPAKQDTTSESRLGSYLAGRFAISERTRKRLPITSGRR
jgi:hypothetical protein